MPAGFRAKRRSESQEVEESHCSQGAGPDLDAHAVHRRTLVLSVGAALLFALVFAAFWPAISGKFIWDDDHYVTENLALRSETGLWDIWFAILTAGPQEYRQRVAPQYYPVTFTSFWLEARSFGTTDPLPLHITNLLLHAWGAWMLWMILRNLGVPGAWAIAAVWAVHPVQAESVDWITERKNVLSGLFYFASLLTYLRFAGLIGGSGAAPTGNARRAATLVRDYRALYLLALLLFVAALLSKSVTGSLPAVVLLVIWWKRGGIEWRRDVLPLVPFFLLAIGMGAVTSYMERNVVGARGAEFEFSFPQRLIIAGRAVWFYAGKLLWPHPLMFIYPRWDVFAPGARWQIALLPAALVVALVLFLLRNRIGRGPVVAVLFFVGTLFPALGFVNVYPMRYSFVADHFQYLASIGVIALIAGSVAWLVSRSARANAVAGGALCLVLGALVWTSHRQSRVYAGPRVLWEDVLAHNPGAWMAHNNLGGLLISSDPPAAAAQFRVTLALKPDHAEAMLNLGRIEEEAGRVGDAIALYRRAIDVRPELAEAHYNLARALARQGDVAGAVEEYWRTIDLDPNHVFARTNLGVLLAGQGKLDQAVNQYQRALALAPDSVPAHVNLGNALLKLNRPDEAIVQWAEALRLEPGDYDLANRLGIILAGTGRMDEAIAMFRRALAIKSDYPPAANNLARALRTRAAGPAATRP